METTINVLTILAAITIILSSLSYVYNCIRRYKSNKRLRKRLEQMKDDMWT